MVATVAVLVDVVRGLREGLSMFWETLWALVLGFTLSGVVQAFVSKDQMRAKLGDHRPASVARASGYGMVSSSCSYAASAMAKSLVAKGADFVSSMAFMIASTNLVVELGIVILVLLGWQFAVAEFVGGPIMIILLALTGGLVFTSALLAAVRKRLVGDAHGGHDHEAMAGVSAFRQEQLEGEPWGTKLRSPAAWSDASSYAVADVTMLRRELVVGYAVAGLVAVLVPTHVWNALFLQGHGFWTTLENALVGPIIAVLSCVCSIGNVPLAATLWGGGISFGGVIAFIFADLIAMPLIFIYRKFYGWKLTVRLVGLFYVLMVVAGLVTELTFRAFGEVPVNRAVATEPAHVGWNYTTYLNLVFLAVAGVVWWLARNKARFGGGDGYAIDPVCGMQVRTEHAPARLVRDGTTFYFCADRCRDRFESDPGRYDRGRAVPEGTGEVTAGMPADGAMGQRRALATLVVDPVCGMAVDPATGAAHRSRDGVDVWFCGTDCAERFDGRCSG
ncbi:MAG TPA: permease [Acidimicrobiales bacterium]